MRDSILWKGRRGGRVGSFGRDSQSRAAEQPFCQPLQAFRPALVSQRLHSGSLPSAYLRCLQVAGLPDFRGLAICLGCCLRSNSSLGLRKWNAFSLWATPFWEQHLTRSRVSRRSPLAGQVCAVLSQALPACGAPCFIEAGDVLAQLRTALCCLSLRRGSTQHPYQPSVGIPGSSHRSPAGSAPPRITATAPSHGGRGRLVRSTVARRSKCKPL